MQSSFNNDFNIRFGPDSHIYNMPLYFGSLNNKKTPVKKNKKYKKKAVHKNIFGAD